MSAMQYRIDPNQQDTQELPPQQTKCGFRWVRFVGIPLSIAAILFLLNGIEPSFQIEDLMDKLGVINKNRYVRMMCLMVVCIAVLLIVKLFRKSPD